MQFGRENSVEVFKTPNRKFQASSIGDIVRDENTSPPRNRNDSASSVHNLTPMPARTVTSRPRTSVADLFQDDSSSKAAAPKAPLQPTTLDFNMPPPQSQPKFATPMSISKSTKAEDLLADISVLKFELAQEKRLREEAQSNLQDVSKMRFSLELELQRKMEDIRKLEYDLKETKTSALIIQTTSQSTENAYRAELAKEQERRKKLEEEISYRDRSLNQELSKSMAKISESQVLKTEVEQSRKTVDSQKALLEEKEMARRRRSMGFHEEQKVRLQMEEELDHLQEEHDQLVEKYHSTVSNLEIQLSSEREKVAMITGQHDLISKELFREKEKVAFFEQELKASRESERALSAAIDQLRSQLHTSLQALTILQQRFDVDTKKSERQLQITVEQLEVLRAAEYQASIWLNQSSASVISEKKNRIDTEGKLAKEQKATATLEEELKAQKNEIVPQLQNQIAFQQQQIHQFEMMMRNGQAQLNKFEQELTAERKLRLDTSQALSIEMEQKRRMEAYILDVQQKAELEIKKEKTARLKLEQELSVLLTSKKI